MRFIKTLLLSLSLIIPTISYAKDTLELNETNTIVLRGAVSGETVANVAQAILKSNANPLYLYITSPGGSVYAGMQLVNILSNIDKPIVCIADTAASMAFIILQACPKRLVMDSSIVMQHVMSYGIEGPEPNNFSYANFVHKQAAVIEEWQAQKLGMELEVFRAKTHTDWWIYGREAIPLKVADDVVNVKCTGKLATETEKKTIQVLFWTVHIEYSKCPIIASPLSVGVSDISPNSPKKEAEIEKLLYTIEQLDKKNWNTPYIKTINK